MNEKDKVTIENSLKQINSESLLDDGGGNVSLYLFENKNTKTNPISVYELNINQDIIDEIRKFSKEHVSSVIDSIPKNGLPNYDPGMVQGIFKIDGREVPVFPEVYQYISGQMSCPPYVKGEVKEDKLKAWIIRFGITVDGKNTQIYFFQRFQPAKMLGSKKKLIIFERGGSFFLFTDNTFSLNHEMDFLLYKNTFIVTKMFSFEKIFNYEDFYRKKASELLNDLAAEKIPKLKDIIIFADLDDITKAVNKNTPLAHKFYSAQKKRYCEEIDHDKLADLKARHDEIDIDLDPKTRKWIINASSNLQAVARVLNDDYELSQLTDYEYLVHSKEEL